MINNLARHGDATIAPIFIVGMPRSGSTMVESILAGHPKIATVGEVDYVRKAIAQLSRSATASVSPISALTVDLGPKTMRALCRDYRRRIAASVMGGRRAVDKTLVHFHLVGLLHILFPAARVIHVRRNPLDTCFSCYATHFSEEQSFAYDLAELGRYYAAYRRLVEYWRRALPPGMIFDIDYEDIVNDPEGQARRLLAYCGLEWDPAYVQFHERRRWVHSASAAQVRKALYRDSVGRAQVYREFLAPLEAELANIP